MMKVNRTSWLRGFTAGLLVGGAALLFTGCTGVVYTRGPAPVYYDYDYYPAWGIYYYPAGHIYYWREGPRWRSGRRLPPHYDLHRGRAEHLRFHTRQPWTEHRPEHGRPDQRHDHH